MPKPVTRKKRFIDPKNERTTTFALIHRSQKDPLAADPDAPQRVLQAIPTKEEVKKRKEEEREFGVFYDDEYDYLQHLKAREEVAYDFSEVDKFLIEKKPSSNVKLPEVVFPSKKEEEIGLLNKAAPRSGPLLDWDPDIVETLDDAFDHEVVYTLKDEENEEDENDLDQILVDAQADVEEEEGESDEGSEDYDSDELLDDVPSLDDGLSNFSDEETKTKFTNYSMSSSVVPRNDQLNLLDDKFEKFFDEYDEENLGGLELEELEGHRNEDSEVMKQMLQDYDKQRRLARQALDHCKQSYQVQEEDEKEDLEKFVEEEDPEDKFDCESILTTYSNLYNHPKMIKEPSIKPIKVCGKTGIPKDVLGKGLTMAALKQLDRENNTYANDQLLPQDDVMTLASRVSELSFRNKHESRDEKKARKHAVKELRRERRQERKANKDAFKSEKLKQVKDAIHLKSNCNQAIKLV